MVPESIRKIQRPVNTIVQATKNPNVYMVIKRIGCKNVGGRRVPVNGPVVGHIVDGRYVEDRRQETNLDTRNTSSPLWKRSLCPFGRKESAGLAEEDIQ